MNDTTPPRRSSLSNVLAGAIGGLVVLVIGAVLIATEVIDTGDTETRVVREGIPSRSVVDSDDGTRSVSDIYKREGAGVVFVEASGITTESDSPFGLPGDREGSGTGSGFVVDKEGTIVTNAHVVDGADEVRVRFEEDGDFVDAEVLGADLDTDVAVLKIDPDEAKLQPLPLGDSSKIEVGDAVVAIGNPFGFTRTVTTGIVSALQRNIEAPSGFGIPNVIQTDASINPGNSGGPLLDAQGRVIGINSQIATGGSSGSVGIGFAVPVNTAKELLPRLKEGESIDRAYLGVKMAPVTGDIARDLNLEVDYGALIQSVEEGGPADKAGLRGGRTPIGDQLVAGGDLIVKIAGEATRTQDDVAASIAGREPGETVEIEYYRGDELESVEVKLARRPSSLDSGSEQELFPDTP